MARSVVLGGSGRCPQCQQVPRWCTCRLAEQVSLPLQVDVLLHDREALRPTSTGQLLARAIPGARLHHFRPERRMSVTEVQDPARELWILHPFGEPLPVDRPPPERLQVVLIDGSWKQATLMMRHVEGWGRKVCLPMTGESRYWLRAQQGEGQFSTMEALLFLARALGLEREATRLQAQLELNVYAVLRTRGLRGVPERYLQTSAFRSLLEQLV